MTAFVLHTQEYSQACIRGSPLEKRQSVILKQVRRPFIGEVQFILNFYYSTRKKRPFNTGDCLTEVTTWAGLTVCKLGLDIYRYSTSLLPTFQLYHGDQLSW